MTRARALAGAAIAWLAAYAGVIAVVGVGILALWLPAVRANQQERDSEQDHRVELELCENANQARSDVRDLAGLAEDALPPGLSVTRALGRFQEERLPPIDCSALVFPD